MNADDEPGGISELIARIRELPGDPHVPVGTEGYNNYTTQKAHWLGWLGATPASGTYERRTPANRGARYVYNHIVEPRMLLWLIEAAGVEPALVHEARQASSRASSRQSKSKAIRDVVPWCRVARALWGRGT
jgi:hypothetical protein